MNDQFDRLKAALADRYTIESELGSGGMATVYLAEDVKHHRKVAVKLLRPDLAAVIGADRFLREIEIAAQLNHPNILALHDSGEAEGFLYYVMPAVEGESLAALLERERNLPLDTAIRLTEQVASALDYAHRRGVIHRDIKPDNVLLHEGVPMVTDFGIALAVSDSGATRFTGTGMSIGTPHYMSPEQAAGEREVDARTDVYALGCVLFEMLAGEPPFTGDTAQKVIVKRITDPPPDISTLRNNLPAAVSASVAKALATSPEDRYESAAAFATALRADATGAATASRWSHPVAAAALFSMASLGVLGVVYLVMLQLGLPDWVLQAAVGLVIVGLPIIVVTASSERHRMARRGPRWFTWRRAFRGGAIAFGSLALATVGFMAMRALGFGPVATLMATGVLQERDPILLADFANRTTDTTLGATLTELLRIDFSQSRTIRLVDPSTIVAARERMVVDAGVPLDEALARDLAEREGVKAVLVGEVAPVGAGYALSARLLAPADGAVLAAERATAEDDTQLIAAIDRLSAVLRERIGESLRRVRASPALERVTTTSLPALHKYTLAVGPPDPAVSGLMRIQWLQEAVAIDTTFAMAYRRLSTFLGQAGRRDDGHAALRKAFALRSRLPEIEAQVVAGMFYSTIEYDASRIEAVYRSLLAVEPDNQFALINLAVHMSRSRRWAERESLAQRVVAGTGHILGYLHLYQAQLLQRKYDEAQETIDRFQWQGTPTWQFDLETARGEYERAEQQLRDHVANNVSVQWFTGVDVMRLRGKVAEAMELAGRVMSNAPDGSDDYFRAMFRLASLQADYGSVADRLRLLDGYAFDSLPPADRRYLERAEFYAGAGRVDRARELVAEFEAQTAAGIRRQPQIRQAVLRVTGEIALSEARFDDAVTDFTMVNELSAACTRCGLARLAHAWLGAGQAESAVFAYERMLAAPTDGLGEDDARWLPGAHRQLGELYEAQGDTTKAVNAYDDFVELWKDADPDLQPQVADVRRRIAILGGEPGARLAN